ncbi:MAG: ABC transporter permease subunit [Thermoleophilia bacterium]|nr:ABC transporter permease subunit [Thermoleophilia bacterium]
MFSRAIFWQSIKGNYILWVICTVVLTAMLSLPAAFHDPSATAAFMDAIKDTPMAEAAGDQLDVFSSLLGIMSQTVYGFSGLMVAMVFVVVTANTLVASEVDRGSMAYTLSTPTKRRKVVFTKAVFLVLAIVVMYVIAGTAGLLTVQFKHDAVWGDQRTADVKAAAKVLRLDEETVANDLSLIVRDPSAFSAGAAARGLDSSVYAAYLMQAMARDAYAAAAEILGLEPEEVEKTPSLIQNDPAALEAAAARMGMDTTTLSAYIDQLTTQAEEQEAQKEAVQQALSDGLTAAAGHLRMETGKLMQNMGILKTDPAAMAVASEASGLDEATLTMMIDQSLGAMEVSSDLGVDFDPFAFFMMNLGCLLLMFAISGISYLASCIFNLSKHSLGLGAGLPFAFLILYFLSQVNTTLEPLKYFSLVTLFDTTQIIDRGGYWAQFVVLGAVGIMLYVFAMRIFERKDLPL